MYIDEDVVIEKGATIAQNVNSGKSILEQVLTCDNLSVIKDAEIAGESTVAII